MARSVIQFGHPSSTVRLFFFWCRNVSFLFLFLVLFLSFFLSFFLFFFFCNSVDAGVDAVGKIRVVDLPPWNMRGETWNTNSMKIDFKSIFKSNRLRLVEIESNSSNLVRSYVEPVNLAGNWSKKTKETKPLNEKKTR